MTTEVAVVDVGKVVVVDSADTYKKAIIESSLLLTSNWTHIGGLRDRW